jgi:hypothetical protein
MCLNFTHLLSCDSTIAKSIVTIILSFASSWSYVIYLELLLLFYDTIPSFIRIPFEKSSKCFFLHWYIHHSQYDNSYLLRHCLIITTYTHQGLFCSLSWFMNCQCFDIISHHAILYYRAISILERIPITDFFHFLGGYCQSMDFFWLYWNFRR